MEQNFEANEYAGQRDSNNPYDFKGVEVRIHFKLNLSLSMRYLTFR
jgi:hypothetical protein